MPLSPTTHSAEDVIRLLELEPIPGEGGYFRRTADGGPISTARGERHAWSNIFALFTPDQFSALHRLASDELWCFHAGDPLDLAIFHGAEVRRVQLGVAPDCLLQHAVPAGCWQGARVIDGGAWSLVTCTVVPGFHWDDFELGQRAALEKEFPAACELVHLLTRPSTGPG